MFKGTALSLVKHGVNENKHFSSSKKKKTFYLLVFLGPMSDIFLLIPS